MRALDPPPRDVLDIYCGSRPYDDLLPPTARCVGLDVQGNPYGVADVVSDEFLPFSDGSFDLVMCIQGFQYIRDPTYSVGEIRRVLRPGGTVVLTVTHVWDYDRTILERRFTGPELADLLRDWWDVEVRENGGRVVTWVSVTASLLNAVKDGFSERSRKSPVVRIPFAGVYVALNTFGFLMSTLEGRSARGPNTLPTNLLVTARKPLRE